MVKIPTLYPAFILCNTTSGYPDVSRFDFPFNHIEPTIDIQCVFLGQKYGPRLDPPGSMTWLGERSMETNYVGLLRRFSIGIFHGILPWSSHEIGWRILAFSGENPVKFEVFPYFPMDFPMDRWKFHSVPLWTATRPPDRGPTWFRCWCPSGCPAPVA